MPYLLRHLFIAEVWWKPYAITTVIASILSELLPLVFAPWAILMVTGPCRFCVEIIKYVSCPLSIPLGKCIYLGRELVGTTLAKHLTFVEDAYLDREELQMWIRLHEEEGILENGIADVFKRCVEVGTETVGMKRQDTSGQADGVKKNEECLAIDVKRKIDVRLKEVVGTMGEGDSEWLGVLDCGDEDEESQGYWIGGKVEGWVVGVVDRKVGRALPSSTKRN